MSYGRRTSALERRDKLLQALFTLHVRILGDLNSRGDLFVMDRWDIGMNHFCFHGAVSFTDGGSTVLTLILPEPVFRYVETNF